jgi:hypothetical protein
VTGRAGTFVVESDDGQSERLLSGETEIPARSVPSPNPAGAGSTAARVSRPSPSRPSPAAGAASTPPSPAPCGAKGPLPVDPRDAVAALEVLDAARRSAARGEVVRLSRAG